MEKWRNILRLVNTIDEAYMTSVSNLDLHEVFIPAEELLARREKLRLRGAGDAGA
jgi:hypothetical protein